MEYEIVSILFLIQNSNYTQQPMEYFDVNQPGLVYLKNQKNLEEKDDTVLDLSWKYDKHIEELEKSENHEHYVNDTNEQRNSKEDEILDLSGHALMNRYSEGNNIIFCRMLYFIIKSCYIICV